MPTPPGTLGGRLPLLDPQTLTPPQREMYDFLNATMIPWAEKSGFQGTTDGGRFIGPFNPLLFSPQISHAFIQLQLDEAKHTTLSKREREVVILTVGAVWRADYERYAHSAVARTVGLPEDAIRTLAAGGLPDGLTEREQLAQRYTHQLATGHRVEAALYRDAERAFGHEGLVNLAVLAGLYHLVSGLLNSFEIPVPA